MRVVSGKFKGRRFGPKMKNWPTRPTTDYCKESVFNVLDNIYYFEGKKILDLFGGTGSITLEFISRGVEHVTIVENYAPCIKYIHELMKEFDCEDQVNVVGMDVIKYIEHIKEQYDIIFVDPPYSLARMIDIPNLIFDNSLIKEGGMLILEHSNLHDFSNYPHFKKVKSYGQTIVSFFEL